jgi:hypothetical protein
MPREANDAWMRIPPLDRLAGEPFSSGPPPPFEDGEVHFSLCLKGTQVLFALRGPDQEIAVRFRYRRREAAWEMSRRVGTRWVSNGPPSASVGELLQGIVLVAQGWDPRAVFDGFE